MPTKLAGSLTRNRIAAVAACAIVIAAIGIINHSRAPGRVAASATPGPAPSSNPTRSAFSCVRALSSSTPAMLSVADVWPGSGGGGNIDASFDLTGCAAGAPAAASAASACQPDAFSALTGAGELYLAGLGARTVRSRQLVHAPLAAVTETAVTFSAADSPGAFPLVDMIKACGSSLPAGLLVSAATSAASPTVVIVEYDDESLTSTLRAKILARAQVLAGG